MYVYENKQYLDEADLREANINKIAGVDEAGYGGGAGPVSVCCCMLQIEHGIVGIKDSKKLSEKRREELYVQIMDRALSVSISMATHEEIDRINIFATTTKCVYSAIKNMKIMPEFVVVDGRFNLDDLEVPWVCVEGADGAQIYEKNEKGRNIQVGNHYENVSAASIVAKVSRDRLMREYDKQYPEYGFAQHKGYLTKGHREALQKYGPCPIHRLTFRGVC